MPRKSDGMTPRQRQSRRIMYEKAALKRRKAIMSKLYVVGGSALCVVLLFGSVWVWKTGVIGRTAQTAVNGAYKLTAKGGFAVQALYLEGRSRTSMDDIEKALDVKKGDPILQLSINELRERLEKIESVKFAAVERALPGTLHVRIVEREPVALWQKQGKMLPVDDNGVVMKDIDPAPYHNLPLIVGDDAPGHVKELLAILSSERELVRRFAAAVYVGERRWNIRLNGNGGTIEVKLPEADPAAAWKELAELQAREQVLDRDIKMIDLRLEGRMFIKLSPNRTTDKATNAKET